MIIMLLSKASATDNISDYRQYTILSSIGTTLVRTKKNFISPTDLLLCSKDEIHIGLGWKEGDNFHFWMNYHLEMQQTTH